jgi:GYF domain 2
MNYFVSREGNEYGPYTLADLQRYVASGNILVTDLTRSEGMSEWVPVSQVIGNIPVPVAASATTVAAGPVYPTPPGLHWGLAIFLGVITCGMFGWVWVLIEAVFVRKLQPASKAMYWLVGAISLFVLTFYMSMSHQAREFILLPRLGGFALWLVGVFTMRSELEEHYNNAEPIALDLSGVMTFFFNVYYFQYHLYRIAELKKTQQLSMAQGA